MVLGEFASFSVDLYSIHTGLNINLWSENLDGLLKMNIYKVLNVFKSTNTL